MTDDTTDKGAVAGVERAAKNVASIPSAVYHAFTDDPRDEGEQKYSDEFGSAMLGTKRLMMDQMVESYQKGKKLADLASKEDNPQVKEALQHAANIHLMGSFVPLVGPLAADVVERGVYGDVQSPEFRQDPTEFGATSDPSGAAAELGTYTVLPKVAKEATDAAKGVVGNALQRLPIPDTTQTVDIPNEEPSSVPVQARGAVLQFLKPLADQNMLRQNAGENTGPAVAEGMGRVAQSAAETNADITPSDADRFGINAVADAKINQAKAVFNKIDELSGNRLSEAQQAVEDAADDFTAEGKKAYREAVANQDALFDEYANHPDLKGMDVQQARTDYSQGMANKVIAKVLNKATEPSETGNMDYQLKQGSQLANAIDDLVKNKPDVLKRAGWTQDHINAAKQFGQIVREQAVNPASPVNQITQSAARYLIAPYLFLHFGGTLGLASELVAERVVGSIVGHSLVGDGIALKLINTGVKMGAKPDTVGKAVAGKLASQPRCHLSSCISSS